jgi:hypothetical protein
MFFEEIGLQLQILMYSIAIFQFLVAIIVGYDTNINSFDTSLRACPAISIFGGCRVRHSMTDYSMQGRK